MWDSTRSTRGRSNATYSVSGSVPRSQVHHDLFPSVQAFQPLAAAARGLPAGQKVGQAPGRGRLLAWFVGSVRPAPLTVATGDLAGVPTGAETRGGRDLADGQARLLGFGAGPDPLSLGPFRAFRASCLGLGTPDWSPLSRYAVYPQVWPHPRTILSPVPARDPSLPGLTFRRPPVQTNHIQISHAANRPSQ